MYPHIHTSLQIAGVAASWETLSQPYTFVQIAQGQPPDFVGDCFSTTRGRLFLNHIAHVL